MKSCLQGKSDEGWKLGNKLIKQETQTDFAPESATSRRVGAAIKGYFIHFLLTVIASLAFPTFAAAEERIMIYGDSLSAAFGIDPKDGWVALLQARLKPEGTIVVNSSISGETTRGGVNRIKTDLSRVRPTLVVIALGANDGLRGFPVAETRKNLQALIAAVQATRAKVVLVGIQIPPNYGIEYSQQFKDLYFQLAKQHKLPPPLFLLEGFADKLEFFQADRLHPKAEAQLTILENVLPAIRKAMSSRGASPITVTKP